MIYLSNNLVGSVFSAATYGIRIVSEQQTGVDGKWKGFVFNYNEKVS